MVRKVIIEKFGGPENMFLVDVDPGLPGPGEILIRHERVGVNYIDTYHRTGLYPMDLPHGLGMEAAGIVEAVGDGVSHLKPGDRAAYAANPPGAYCGARVMPAAQVVPLPDEISFSTAAAMMLQGMTVEYLFHRTTPLKAGDTVLFHAAAGGVGLIACQWAKSEGIKLIGTAGTDDKCHEALSNGATHCINYRDEDFVARVRALTGGAGVDVVMDGVGADTFSGSLDSLKPLGMMISFGNASGPVPPFSLSELASRGSLKITRPALFTHTATHETCMEMARHVFDKVLSHEVIIHIDQRFPLDAVTEVHQMLESRKTTGSTILIPLRPAPTLLAGRMERALRNMFEALPVFLTLALLAVIQGIDSGLAVTGAAVFFFARVAYVPAYGSGIVLLRSGVWTVGFVGLILMVVGIL